MNKTVIYILFSLSFILNAQDVDRILKDADSMFNVDRLYSESTMTVVKNGKAKPAQGIVGYSMRIGGKYNSLSLYTSPARMKGTAYLMIEDDLWVRFSSTGRVRKLSSSARKNSAGGSDFSYADMGDGGNGLALKYSASIVGMKDIDGISCYEIEMLPKKEKDNPYDKLVAYVSVSDNRYIEIDHYEGGANIKTMYLKDYRETGPITYPFIIEMKSNTKKSVTVVETQFIEIDSSKVNKRLFTQGYLESIR